MPSSAAHLKIVGEAGNGFAEPSAERLIRPDRHGPRFNPLPAEPAALTRAMRARVRVCVRACVCACVRACIRTDLYKDICVQMCVDAYTDMCEDMSLDTVIDVLHKRAYFSTKRGPAIFAVKLWPI